jgi:hypothetical protein
VSDFHPGCDGTLLFAFLSVHLNNETEEVKSLHSKDSVETEEKWLDEP